MIASRLWPIFMFAMCLLFPTQGSGDNEKPMACHRCCEQKLQQCNKSCSSYNLLCQDGCKTVFAGCLDMCIAKGQPAITCSLRQ